MTSTRRRAKAIASVAFDLAIWIITMILIWHGHYAESTFLLVILAWRDIDRRLDRLDKNRPDIHIFLNPEKKSVRVVDHTARGGSIRKMTDPYGKGFKR